MFPSTAVDMDTANRGICWLQFKKPSKIGIVYDWKLQNKLPYQNKPEISVRPTNPILFNKEKFEITYMKLTLGDFEVE